MAESPLLHNRYRILRRLGRGAFATVYLADDTRMERQVAIKVVRESADADGRALREAKAAAKLNHPHIVHVFEVIQEEGQTLLFTEYVEGDTLRTLYGARRLSDRDILALGVQVCRALEHGHKRGVIHRDIKPENLMVVAGEEPDVRVMDFGVAHLEDHSGVTQQGDVVGTLAYMAPEQLAGEAVDPRADVYALCVTLYEGLTGRNPLRGKTLPELVHAPGLQQLPPLRQARPDLPSVLDEGLHRGLATVPEERLDATGLRRYLEKALRELPGPEPEGPNLTERTAVRLEEAAYPERLAFLARHLAAGGLALVSLVYLLGRTEVFPPDWTVPLAAGLAFVTLLVPLVGAAAVVAVYALVAFAFGIGWGLLFLLVAVPVLVLLRRWRREWGALLPLAAPWLAGVGLGLAVPPLAGIALRRWGLLLAFLAATAIGVAAGFEGWSQVPFSFATDVGPELAAARYTSGPGGALSAGAGLLDSYPVLLLQALLFGLFGLAAAYLVTEGSRPLSPRRQWGVAGYLASLFAAFVLLPPLVTGSAVDLAAFFLAYIPCVIIVTLFGLLMPAGEPHTTLGR